MRAVAIDPARLYAWAAEPSALGAVELAQECRAPCPVTPRTLRRMKGRQCEFTPAGAPLLLSAELCEALLALIDGTRAGVSAFRLACEVLPRARGAAAVGRPLALPHRNVMKRLQMSAPTVVRAMKALALAGLVRMLRGKYTKLVLIGCARSVISAPRSHLKRLPKGRKTKETSEPREARPPVSAQRSGPRISAEQVAAILEEITGAVPSARGARRCAYRASRAGYRPRTLAALAAGAAETLRRAETQSAAGVLGWLAEQHSPPPELGLAFRAKAQRIGKRLHNWVQAHSGKERMQWLSGTVNGRLQRMPLREALVHAAPWGYHSPQVARALVLQAGLTDKVPQTLDEFHGRNRANSGFCDDYPLRPVWPDCASA